MGSVRDRRADCSRRMDSVGRGEVLDCSGKTSRCHR